LRSSLPERIQLAEDLWESIADPKALPLTKAQRTEIERRLVFRPEADLEIKEAAEWYEARGQGIAVEFLYAAMSEARPNHVPLARPKRFFSIS
jgi:hypothetical protein